jgi:hypothetical protein
MKIRAVNAGFCRKQQHMPQLTPLLLSSLGHVRVVVCYQQLLISFIGCEFVCTTTHATRKLRVNIQKHACCRLSVKRDESVHSLCFLATHQHTHNRADGIALTTTRPLLHALMPRCGIKRRWVISWEQRRGLSIWKRTLRCDDKDSSNASCG